MVDVFIVVPKNRGLQRYREAGVECLSDKSNMMEARGEDIPSWVEQLQSKGKRAIGLTGEDLYREYALERRESTVQVLRRISWKDPKAMFGKPCLCLLGPEGKTLEDMPKELTVAISPKYRMIGKKYLNFLERKGFRFRKLYMNGSVESSCSQGISDLAIDIVYSGKTMETNNLLVYDKILESDFLIIGTRPTISPRSEISKMKVYDPPTSGRRGKLRLDFNENTVGCSTKVIEAIKKLDAEDMSVYPEYGKLKAKLADYLNVRVNEVLPSNGTDEAINLIFNTYLRKGDDIILPYPAYAMFEVYASIIGVNVNKVLYNKDLSFPTKRILDSISEKTKLIVLINPNNPTASDISDDDIISILQKARNSIVLIDEAYYQFMGRSSKELIKNYDNLIIIQTFSKAFGLAGLRIGYIVSNPDIISDISKVASPYSVNSIAVVSALAALDDIGFVEDYAREVQNSKLYLEKSLKALAVKVFPSSANFLVADFKDKSSEICSRLRQKDILVRDRSNYPLMKGCLRIGIGTIGQSVKLMTELKKILKPMLIFDIDGVLVDVSKSLREAIRLTVKAVTNQDITEKTIQQYKNRGGYNNDWDLTEAIIKDFGSESKKKDIIERFQGFYLGGLIDNEKLLLNRRILQNLSKQFELAIVTGRPREEAEYVLKNNDVLNLFTKVVAMEDVSVGKPDPEGLLKFSTKNAFYFGDTVDDMQAAKQAGIRPIGVLPPSDKTEDLRRLLIQNGADKVIASIDKIEEVLV